MNTAATLEPEEAPRDTSPWAWPREMLGHVLQTGEGFSGLNRRIATMISRWLWAAEAVVRRLLLAAALALDVPLPKPATPAKPQPNKPTPEPTSEPAKRTAAFRVFAIRHSAPGATPATEPALAAVRSPAPFNSVVGALQRDPLLRIGAEFAPRRRSRSRRRRAERISRYDPLYVHNEGVADHFYARPSHDRTGYREPSIEIGRDKRSPWHVHFTSRPDPLEDRTLYPAPSLALRAQALLRVLQAPDAAALRLARTLSRLDIARFENAGIPIYTRGNTDLAPAPPGRLQIEDARCTLREALERRRPPDTS